MNKIKILLTIIVLVGILCACGANKEENEKIEEKWKDLVITSEEEALLIRSFNGDEKDENRIKSGDLYDSEKRCIIYTRETLEYLEKKYPDTDFKIVRYESPYTFVGGHDYPIVTYIDNSGSDKEFTINLESDDNSEIIYEDDYYGVLIRERYDQYLMDILSEEGYEDCVTYTEINGRFGTEVDGNTSAEVFAGLKASRISRIFVSSNKDDKEKVAEAVEKIMREKDFYGSYSVYVLDDVEEISDDGEELFQYVKDNGDKIVKRNFNSWNE